MKIGKRALKSPKIAYIVLIILVSITSYTLGRISILEENKGKYEILTAQDIYGDDREVEGLIVASSKGTKYYFAWCSGAEKISENNKIYFNSEKEAKNAGYESSSTCYGLKE